jgi:hypothetical protein
MMEVLVKEQAVAQRNRFTSFKLLEWIMEALKRSLPQQAGVVPMAERMEVIPVIIADVERVHTLLFLMDLDLMDLPFALEADKDSEEDSGHSSKNEGSRNRNEGGGSENEGSGSKDRSFRAMDGDAMVE